MKFVDNGVPEDFAKLTFEGMSVPLCELSEEEFMEVVFGIKGYKRGRQRGTEIFIDPQPEENQWYDLSVDDLDLSVRAAHCLLRANIKTIGELCSMTEFDLSKLRNMGVKTLKEIKDKLAEKGLCLRRGEEDN